MNTPPDPASDDEGTTSGHGPGSNEPPGVPRWVTVSAIVIGIVVVLVVIVMLIGGGDHGPSRHTGAGVPTPASVPVMQPSSGG